MFKVCDKNTPKMYFTHIMRCVHTIAHLSSPSLNPISQKQ